MFDSRNVKLLGLFVTSDSCVRGTIFFVLTVMLGKMPSFLGLSASRDLQFSPVDKLGIVPGDLGSIANFQNQNSFIVPQTRKFVCHSNQMIECHVMSCHVMSCHYP